MGGCDGRVAVVTGGGRGIGRATALALGRAGAAVAVLDLDLDAAEATARDLGNCGRPALALRADVTDRASVEGALADAEASFGRIDILANVAGGSNRVAPRLEDLSDDDWDAVVGFNLRSAFLVTRAVVPLMRRHGYGRIVNVASLAGRFRSVTGTVAYAAAKAGVIGFTKHASAELAGYGITINAVAPGLIFTERVRATFERKPPEARAAFLASVPLARPGTADEVAAAIAFLCTDGASYITGATLDVNGGVWSV